MERIESDYTGRGGKKIRVKQSRKGILTEFFLVLFPHVEFWQELSLTVVIKKGRNKTLILLSNGGGLESFGSLVCSNLCCLFWMMCQVCPNNFRLPPQAYSADLDPGCAGIVLLCLG